LKRLRETGRPVVLGVSRKSFLHAITGERDWATVALSSYATSRGVSVIRVHDVGANLKGIQVTQSILEACA
jgi:dihydropteroate synthase